MITAAGVLFLAGDDPWDMRALLIRRTVEGDHEGEWSIPGGKIEEGETAEEAAIRECEEELGLVHFPNDLELLARRIYDGVDYTTFSCRVPEPFDVTLNEEHDAFDWVPVGRVSGVEEGRSDSAPSLPPGVTVKRFETVQNGEAAGYYDPETKTIHLASHLRLSDGLRELSNPARLEAHEAGHAVDHALGWASHDDAFSALLEPARDLLEPEEVIGADYYLGNPEEAFAEAYAVLHGPAPGARYFGTLEPDRARETMGEIIGWVKNRVSSGSISKPQVD